MAGGSSTISSSEPKLGALQVQTSMYGLAVPLVWGRTRITGNLVWYDDFEAIAHTEVTESGGKGGGGVKQERTTYTYNAAVILGLCAGPINAIVSAWKGKQRYIGEEIAGAIKTKKYTVVVPAGGVVTVPSAANFRATVAVRDPNFYNSGETSTGG